MAGIKYDNDKLRMDLIPMDSIRDVAAVYTMGAKKYADENWREGISWKRIYGAVLRHISLWFLGQDRDEESGLSHLAHAAWGLLTLLNYTRTHPELDDRPILRSNGSNNPRVDATAGTSESPVVSRFLPGTAELVRGSQQVVTQKESPGITGA